MKNKKIKITPEHIRSWLGDDATREEMMQIIADIANGVYDAKDLKDDIEGTCDL